MVGNRDDDEGVGQRTNAAAAQSSTSSSATVTTTTIRRHHVPVIIIIVTRNTHAHPNGFRMAAARTNTGIPNAHCAHAQNALANVASMHAYIRRC
mmetsp:Transcript_25307/g.70892  ORF Transcript_25307/g.70892 Transcript_25307/m.70892 type:complete len:95 (-) Transcript_25307:2019-2303(-)